MDAPLDLELKFMRAIFNASKDGILVVNHKNSAIIARNEKFFQIFRIPSELRSTTDDQVLIHEVIGKLRNPGQFVSLVTELYKQPEKSSHDFIELNDGRMIERHSEAVIVDAEILGRVWYFTDITLARDRDSELKTSQAKLISSSRLAEIGEMAGGIAHEINNPLAIIQGKAQQLVIRHEQGTLTMERLRNDLAKIESMSERIAKIIRSLKTFSRDSTHDPMSLVEVRRVVDETLELCQQKIIANQIALHCEGDSHIFISCRPSQIGQVLLNLIGNAIDAVELLPVKWIKIAWCIENENIEIRVTDSGSGIDPAIVEKIVQPFFTTKELGRGTGLGLSVSLGIVHDHGGKLSYVAQAPNTEFLVTLPLAKTLNAEEAA